MTFACGGGCRRPVQGIYCEECRDRKAEEAKQRREEVAAERSARMRAWWETQRLLEEEE